MRFFTASALCIALFGTTSAFGLVTVGEHVTIDLETDHPYVSSRANDSVLTWAREIYHPGATYISVHFSRFQLAQGDYLVIRSEDGQQKWTYRDLGRRDLGIGPDGFFATHIKGEKALIELYTQGDSASWGLRIDRYGRGFSDQEIAAFWDAGLGKKMNLARPAELDESICTTDDTREAKCYQDSEPDMYDKGRAVVRLLLNGSAHCTGWLVGCEGHVMTNEHCIGDQAQANNIDFEFMAEGTDCATNCASSLACPGTIEASGGTLISVDAPLDYAMVMPDTTVGGDTDLPATYGFMQLRDTGAVQDEQIYITQYPAGWGKRFAFESTYPEDVTLGGNTYAVSLAETACSGGGSPDVGYWADTQGGSSGSPVVGYSDHRVVALHHCRGSAFCSSGDGNTDDPNRGVPIQDIITHLGANLPNCATCEPPDAPANLTATANGDNQIDLAWDAVSGVDSYQILRATGSCPGSGWMEIASGVATTSFSDTSVSGGTTYSYAIKSFIAATSCESTSSTCDDAVATGACLLAPDFAGITSAETAGAAYCVNALAWNAAVGHCGSNVVYNVYASDTGGFTPGPGNLIASCLPGLTHTDSDVDYGVERFYVVRAEDDSGNGSGSCSAGNEETNSVELSASATGPDTEAFADDMESAPAGWTLSAGTGDTGTSPWTPVTDQSNSSTTSFFVSDEAVVKDMYLTTTASISVPATSSLLEFWHWHNTESNWDGGVLEISTDGTTFVDILDGNSARFLEGAYNSTLTSSANPISGRGAWSGDSSGWIRTTVDLSDFAGQSVWLRWRMGCDASVSDVGWWLDDVRVYFGSQCLVPEIFADGFESGNTSAWSAASPAP